MYKSITESLITDQDIDVLREEVELLTASLYKDQGKGFERVMRNSLRASTSSLIEESLAKANIEKAEFLKGLLKELEKFEALKLTVAKEPSRGGLKKISQWVKANVSENVALDISVDKQVVAGAIISYRGKYRDYSFDKQYSEKFADRKTFNGLLE